MNVWFHVELPSFFFYSRTVWQMQHVFWKGKDEMDFFLIQNHSLWFSVSYLYLFSDIVTCTAHFVPGQEKSSLCQLDL